jgi:hypothetical protein
MPFWFTILKSAENVRLVVARREKEERTLRVSRGSRRLAPPCSFPWDRLNALTDPAAGTPCFATEEMMWAWLGGSRAGELGIMCRSRSLDHCKTYGDAMILELRWVKLKRDDT